MEYKLVDKSELPILTGGRKWRALFDPLLNSKAICFDCDTKGMALHLAATIRSALRRKRCGYTVGTVTVPSRVINSGEDDGTYKLYVWKENVK